MQKLYIWRRFTDRLKADADGTPQDEYLIEDLPKILRERVKKITGLPDWKTSPGRSMKTLGDELDAHEARTDNPHSVTAAQAQAVPTTQRGSANGVATLDATTKIPISQIPDTVVGGMDYQGTWNASTNVPAITTISKSKGDYWKVATAGATNLSGTTDWKIGDWAVWNGSSFDKIDNTDQVTSVEGRQGAVALNDLYPKGVVGTPQDGQVWTYDSTTGGGLYRTLPDPPVSPVLVQSNYTILATDRTILVDATGASRTITLPTATGRAGKRYIVKKVDNSANAVTLSGGTIDGASSVSTSLPNDALEIESDGTNWRIVSSPTGGSSTSVEAWSVPTLQSSWTNFGGTYLSARYRKEPGGFIRLEGLLKDGSITKGAAILTLPAGYRPSADHILFTTAANQFADLYMYSSGVLACRNVPANASLTLTGIGFVAA